VIAGHDLYCSLLPQCEALLTCRWSFPIATTRILELSSISRSRVASECSSFARPSNTDDHTSSLPAVEAAASNSEPINQQLITAHLIGVEVHTAEVYWTLGCMNNRNSHNSPKGKSDLFRSVFPDSVIAKQFS